MKSQNLQLILSILDKSLINISGKYFKKIEKIEVTNIQRYCLSIAKSRGLLLTPDDMRTILFNILPDEEVTTWYPPSIVTSAIDLGVLPKDTKLAIDLDEKQLLILNRLLYHSNEDEVLFITTGIGGSGKSTFLNVIKQLFDNDFSASSLSDLGEPFIVAEAVKHRLICSDELAKGTLDCAILKTLCSKQFLDVNPKNRTPYRIKCQSSLFFCCNKAPKVDITDSGILRRIIFYERNTKIANPIASLNSHQWSREELLTIARVALGYERDDWRDVFLKETHRYLKSNNSVYLTHSDDGEIEYATYVDRCKLKGLKPYSEPVYDEIVQVFKEWALEEIKTIDAELPF